MITGSELPAICTWQQLEVNGRSELRAGTQQPAGEAKHACGAAERTPQPLPTLTGHMRGMPGSRAVHSVTVCPPYTPGKMHSRPPTVYCLVAAELALRLPWQGSHMPSSTCECASASGRFQEGVASPAQAVLCRGQAML